MAESATFLELYKNANCARHFQAVTTIDNQSMHEAYDKVTADIGPGTFIALLEQYQNRSVEDMAADLGISYEVAGALRQLTGMG